ncbi:MAG TPA: phycobilisome protein [Kamptonema sp.]|nr:phycobilisome protein [Kamptonema sp.]
MPGINTTWEKVINQSDGRYLNNTELQTMQRYVQTFSVRSKTYEILRDKSDSLVTQAMKKFMLVHPEIVQKHSQRCVYDMKMTMCIMALAILRDDQQFFKECLSLWLTNILQAYQKNLPCLKAYCCLQEILKEQLPAAANQLITPYIEIVLQALDTPAKLMATVHRGGAKI